MEIGLNYVDTNSYWCHLLPRGRRVDRSRYERDARFGNERARGLGVARRDRAVDRGSDSLEGSAPSERLSGATRIREVGARSQWVKLKTS